MVIQMSRTYYMGVECRIGAAISLHRNSASIAKGECFLCKAFIFKVLYKLHRRLFESEHEMPASVQPNQSTGEIHQLRLPDSRVTSRPVDGPAHGCGHPRQGQVGKFFSCGPGAIRRAQLGKFPTCGLDAWRRQAQLEKFPSCRPGAIRRTQLGKFPTCQRRGGKLNWGISPVAAPGALRTNSPPAAQTRGGKLNWGNSPVAPLRRQLNRRSKIVNRQLARTPIHWPSTWLACFYGETGKQLGK